MAEAFTFFWKHRLSQWHRSPFTIGGVTFTHAEQYMMYAKAMLFADRVAAEQILAAETPREQQAIGRTVRGFDESMWVLFREGIVFAGNYARFSQNADDRELLSPRAARRWWKRPPTTAYGASAWQQTTRAPSIASNGSASTSARR